MQRQAVPLVRAEAPFVGTGMERSGRAHSGASIGARRTGIVDQVDATRIVVRATEEADPTKPGVDIYRLMKFQRSNQNTCINQRPLVKVGDQVKKGDIIADGPSTELGELALGRNVLVAFMPWNGYNFEDFDPALRAHRQGRRVLLDPHRGVRGDGARHQARARGNHPRHSERVGRSAEEPRSRPASSISAPRCAPATSSAARSRRRAKADDAEEKLLRAIFGEKASDVRDTSLRVPPGVQGTVVEVRVFNRHGVEKDERALSPSSARRSSGSPRSNNEQAVLDRNVYGRLAEMLEGRQGIAGPKGFKKNSKITRAVLEEYPRSQWWQFASPNDKLMAEIEAIRKQYDESKKGLEQRFLDKVEKLQRGDVAAGVMKMVKVFVAVKRKTSPATRWPAATATRAWCRRSCRSRDMPFLEDGTQVDIVLESVGRAQPDERRTDPGDPVSAGPAPASACASGRRSMPTTPSTTPSRSRRC